MTPPSLHHQDSSESFCHIIAKQPLETIVRSACRFFASHWLLFSRHCKFTKLNWTAAAMSSVTIYLMLLRYKATWWWELRTLQSHFLFLLMSSLWVAEYSGWASSSQPSSVHPHLVSLVLLWCTHGSTYMHGCVTHTLCLQSSLVVIFGGTSLGQTPLVFYSESWKVWAYISHPPSHQPRPMT